MSDLPCEANSSGEHLDATDDIQDVNGTMWLVVALVLAHAFLAGGALGWLIGFTMGRIG